MKLQDQLYDAVADVSADLPALAAASRRRGLALRRRRRALTSVGAAAAALVIAGAGVALRPEPGTPVLTEPGFASEALSGATAPDTGRTTAASLVAAVEQVADGTFSGFEGSDPSTLDSSAAPESYAAVRFSPDGGPAGSVYVNIQDVTTVYDAECEGGSEGCRYVRPRRWGCEPYMTDCQVRTLADGDTLRTYRDNASSPSRDADHLSAELISPHRQLRLVIGATNMTPGEQVTRRDAVLSTAQLGEIAQQPWWGFRLPREYAEAGKRLPSYRDASADES